jgi:hypothetical protein
MYGTSLKERMESKFLILYMQLTHMDDIWHWCKLSSINHEIIHKDELTIILYVLYDMSTWILNHMD